MPIRHPKVCKVSNYSVNTDDVSDGEGTVRGSEVREARGEVPWERGELEDQAGSGGSLEQLLKVPRPLSAPLLKTPSTLQDPVDDPTLYNYAGAALPESTGIEDIPS